MYNIKYIVLSVCNVIFVLNVFYFTKFKLILQYIFTIYTEYFTIDFCLQLHKF